MINIVQIVSTWDTNQYCLGVVQIDMVLKRGPVSAITEYTIVSILTFDVSWRVLWCCVISLSASSPTCLPSIKHIDHTHITDQAHDTYTYQSHTGILRYVWFVKCDFKLMYIYITCPHHTHNISHTHHILHITRVHNITHTKHLYRYMYMIHVHTYTTHYTHTHNISHCDIHNSDTHMSKAD